MFLISDKVSKGFRDDAETSSQKRIKNRSLFDLGSARAAMGGREGGESSKVRLESIRGYSESSYETQRLLRDFKAISRPSGDANGTELRMRKDEEEEG